ncbi:hypothetical protein KBB08_02510 [Candidatus Gracilibacteria bacterium]|nr:hypothetical protein [Candidatus Gracilibacteria bacterium]
MVGVLLMVVAACFIEIGAYLSKHEVENHHESLQAMMFLNTFCSAFLFLAVALWNDASFVIYSWPILVLGAVFSIVSALVGSIATIKSQMSQAGLFRLASIPLLLLVDYFLGYDISPLQFGGIAMILAILVMLSFKHEWDKPSVRWLMLNAFLVVIDVTLYKYSIDRVASLEMIQLMYRFSLLLYCILVMRLANKEHVLRHLATPIAWWQSAVIAIGAVLSGFAFSYGPPSIILAAYRSAQAFWSLIIGALFFYERSLAIKILILVFLIFGVTLLIP